MALPDQQRWKLPGHIRGSQSCGKVQGWQQSYKHAQQEHPTSREEHQTRSFKHKNKYTRKRDEDQWKKLGKK